MLDNIYRIDVLYFFINYIFYFICSIINILFIYIYFYVYLYLSFYIYIFHCQYMFVHITLANGNVHEINIKQS